MQDIDTHMKTTIQKLLTADPHRAGAGFSLLEVLIALVILSVGLLGIAALISTALKSNGSAYMRTQATAQAYNIIDRMRANYPGALNLDYNTPMPATAAPSGSTACTGSGASCGSSALAAYDISQWEYDLATHLPQGRGSVTSAISATSAGSLVTVNVRVLWNDRVAHDSLQKTGAPTATTFSLSISSVL